MIVCEDNDNVDFKLCNNANAKRYNAIFGQNYDK